MNKHRDIVFTYLQRRSQCGSIELRRERESVYAKFIKFACAKFVDVAREIIFDARLEILPLPARARKKIRLSSFAVDGESDLHYVIVLNRAFVMLARIARRILRRYRFAKYLTLEMFAESAKYQWG